MLQVQLLPAYALTIHKIQALTIRDDVLGCLEAVFANGQIYVLISRVTDPLLFKAVGLPPLDLLELVAKAWQDNGFDVDELLEKACQVSGEWTYTTSSPDTDPAKGIRKRLKATYQEKRSVPLRWKS